MERKGRCRRVKSSIYGNHRFSRFCDHNNQRAFDQKGFSRLVLLSNSWNVLQLKYRTTGFAYFSRRMNAVSENHDGRDAFKMLNREIISQHGQIQFFRDPQLYNQSSPTVLLVQYFLKECSIYPTSFPGFSPTHPTKRTLGTRLSLTLLKFYKDPC